MNFKLPEFNPPTIEINEEAMEQIAESNRQKELQDKFRFWFIVALTILGIIVAVLQLRQEYSNNDIKEKLQEQSQIIIKLSSDLNDLHHQVAKTESSIVKLQKVQLKKKMDK